ncbi:hypothetical protein TWF481_009239 [Arthrobotrys musiformis]|uniref:Uncharacterized protein n=1 Tax=Arthrobotrys musiformis TaxID=47236 RepID=A0AAV9W4F8_9PEZI
MSCSFAIDYASAVSANVFYYANDTSCLGLPGYVNGSDCASWPVASASPSATLIWSPSSGTGFTSTCNAPVFTSGAAGVVHTTVPCNVQNSVLTAAGVASYIFPTAGTNASTFTWSVGPAPGSTTVTTATVPYVISAYTVIPTTVPTTVSTVINSTSIIYTTEITTITTITQLSTLTAGTTTIGGRLARKDISCVPRGPAGTYTAGANVTALIYTDVTYTSTSSLVSSIFPTSWSISNSTIINLTNSTSTTVSNTTLIDVTITTVPAVTITGATATDTTDTIGVDTTSATVATGTSGPYAISIVAVGTTITEGLTRRSLPTGTASQKQKRQSTEGWVGLADEDGTVGVVASQSDALQFYVINGELVADVGGVDWYTYTETTIIEDPGYETWVLQASAPGTGSISTDWQGVELDALDWVNDAFVGTGMAQMCVGSPLSGGTINVIDFWYDTTLSPPGGSCDLVTASIVAVDPTPNPSATETVTSQTTITTISTITGPPVTTYVCNNGGMCPNACTYDTVNLLTTELCSTATDGLSTCQPCQVSTPLPVVETDLVWITSTIECATPPCQTTVIQVAATGAGTVTVYGNTAAAATGTAAVAAAAGTAAAAADAGSDSASSTASSSATSTTSRSSTRTTTPTASPSIALAGKIKLGSGSLMALAFAGAFAFLA